jgi:hypothetical protein
MDILDAAKTLRTYAGILSAISSTPQQQTPAGAVNPTHPQLPGNRPSPQKPGQQINRAALRL